jgi:hypothetical protein
MESRKLPLFNISQVGLNEAKDFLLYDPTLYFSGQPPVSQEYHFGSWLSQILREFL